MSIGIVAESVRTSVPVIACTTPWTIATAISTRWRGSRSAQTPAASTIAASAICRAASTSPSAIAESETCNTAKTSAMIGDAVAEPGDRRACEEKAEVAFGERADGTA